MYNYQIQFTFLKQLNGLDFSDALHLIYYQQYSTLYIL